MFDRLFRYDATPRLMFYVISPLFPPPFRDSSLAVCFHDDISPMLFMMLLRCADAVFAATPRFSLMFSLFSSSHFR